MSQSKQGKSSTLFCCCFFPLIYKPICTSNHVAEQSSNAVIPSSPTMILSVFSFSMAITSNSFSSHTVRFLHPCVRPLHRQTLYKSPPRCLQVNLLYGSPHFSQNTLPYSGCAVQRILSPFSLSACVLFILSCTASQISRLIIPSWSLLMYRLL